MLDAWPACRDPDLAERIEELDAHVVRSRPPLPMEGSKQRAWEAAFDAAGPLDRTQLYDTLAASTPAAAAGRLRRLQTLPPDPRLARRLWACLKEVPYPGKAARALYQGIAAQLVLLEDRRFDDDVLTTARSNHTTGHYTVTRLKGVGSRTALAAFRELVVAVQAREPLVVDTATQEQILQLGERVPRAIAAATGDEGIEAELLAAVYGSPDDDEPRLVYADLLQQRDDPRGEFIVLQCSRGPDDKPSRRERALQKQYGGAWTDGLEPFIRKSGRGFRRGFLSACRYHHGRLHPDPVGVPAWATVEALDCGGHVYVSGSADIILQPHMRALRSVRGITDMDFAAICGSSRPLQLQSIHLRRGTSSAILATLKGCASLPELRILDVSDCGIALPDRVRLQAALPAGVELEG